MLNLERGRVIEVLHWDEKVQILEVESSDKSLREKAINYIAETGICRIGDIVVMNTVGNRLQLGTGGYNFIYLNLSVKLDGPRTLDRKDGHIIKMKYTANQIRVKAVEECIENRGIFNMEKSIPRRPVIFAILHSMVSPLIKAIKFFNSNLNISCIYTYGGAINSNNSFTLKKLRDEGFINGVITAGECYGGDYEAINIISAMLFGLCSLKSDIIIVCCGPGVAGSSTYCGFSTLDFIGAIYTSKLLGLFPVLVPRVSMVDMRERHFGLSMQSLAILKMLDFSVHFPVYKNLEDPESFNYIFKQLSINGIMDKHIVEFIEAATLKDIIVYTAEDTRVMGRDYRSDPYFFYNCSSAGIYSIGLLTKNKNF